MHNWARELFGIPTATYRNTGWRVAWVVLLVVGGTLATGALAAGMSFYGMRSFSIPPDMHENNRREISTKYNSGLFMAGLFLGKRVSLPLLECVHRRLSHRPIQYILASRKKRARTVCTPSRGAKNGCNIPPQTPPSRAKILPCTTVIKNVGARSLSPHV